MGNQSSWRESSARLYRALDEAGVDPDSDKFRDAASWAAVHEFFRRYFLSRNPWKPNRVWLRDHVSRCHNAPVYVAGDRSTHCGKCGETTDPVSLKPMDLT